MVPDTASLKAFPAPTVAMALKRLKGPPLLVSAAHPQVTAIAPQANGSRPASLARKAGERSVAVQSARVSTATAKAVTSETMLRVLPNGWVNVETPTTASATDAAAQFSFCSTSPVSLTGTALHLV
jgi:hypothetical protein